MQGLLELLQEQLCHSEILEQQQQQQQQFCRS
jgi:hypothetical protein